MLFQYNLMEQIDLNFEKYRFVDLTHEFKEGMPSFSPYIHFSNLSCEIGDKYNSHILQLSEHHGTHVDAPFHIGGKKILNDYSIDTWHGFCNVIDLTSKKPGEFVLSEDIKKWEELHGNISENEIVLLNYGWDKKWKIKSKKTPYSGPPEFFDNFPGLSEEVAHYLGRLKIKMLGTDTATVDAFSNFKSAQTLGTLEPAHEILLIEHDVVVIECLRNLDKLPPKGAYLFSFPLNIYKATGSPVRALALITKD